MSNQLAISSAFACFAMAAMALALTPDNSGWASGGKTQAGQIAMDIDDLPQPDIFRIN